MPTLKVEINGTAVNPFHAMGLTRNPFPQIARAQYMPQMDALNRLAAEPISSAGQIELILAGLFSGEFIELCCRQFKPGEVSRFTVEWQD